MSRSVKTATQFKVMKMSQFKLGSFSRLALLASSALMAGHFSTVSVLAQTKTETTEGSDLRGKMSDDSSLRHLTIGENTEKGIAADAGNIPFMISVDGDTVETSASKPTAQTPRQIDRERKTDVDLSSVDIQIKFDGLDASPILNVSTMPVRRSYSANETVEFLASTNYPAFIERSEIRIFAIGDGKSVDKPVAVVPVKTNAKAQWVMPAQADEREYAYVLRVYDEKGRFDETEALTLRRSEKKDILGDRAEAVAPGMGEDRTALRNIRVQGGAVTVHGTNVPDGYKVKAFGETIPVDPQQKFVVQRILRPGDHDIDVGINDGLKGDGLAFNRDITIPDNDWFYVGLADITLRKRNGDNGIEAVRPGEYDSTTTNGRLAFYLKGKIKGEYLLTAAADTTDDELDNMFRNFGKQNPRHLLRKLDPDDYYPVYGDDSTFVEDAPTNGKFYVRLEHGDSRAVWGNFKTRITGTEFMRSDRALYGAQGVYRSEETTSFGERKTEVDLYAAQPDTLPQYEEYLATGGSAYFMRRQNIVEGSETITVEFRDSVTGRVIERRTLRAGEDYRFDYMQGVLILNRPLSSSAGTSDPVRDGALGGNKTYVLAQYEFEPVAGDLDGYSLGGRGQQWLNDNVRVGVTGYQETTGTADQKAGGVDIRVRHSDTTFIEGEVAGSDGQGFGFTRSTDGGLTNSNTLATGNKGRTALAWRLKGQIDLADIQEDGVQGKIGGYYEEKEAGFSSLFDNTSVDKRLWGAHADLDVTDKTRLKLIYDDFWDADGQIKREGKTSVSHEIDEYWKVSFGVTYTELMSPTAIRSGKTGYDGSRVDTGMRIDYRQDDDHLYYVFGQVTAGRSGDIKRNDRIGVGTELKLTDTIGTQAEISYGTNGLGGLAALTYDPNADDHYYVGYRLDPDRAFDLNRSYDLIGRDKGAIVGGVKRRMNDVLSAYSEGNYDLFGVRSALTHTYGVVYTPDNVWTFDGGFEGGRVRDNTTNSSGVEYSDFDRYAPSLAIGYKDEERGITGRLRGEVRVERSDDHTRDQNTYLLAGAYSWKTNPDWRALVSVDAVLSDTKSDVTSFQNTDYVEASFGYAYRPVENDRLNALFKYSWLYDMPGNGQLGSGVSNYRYAPAQRSHILSADFTYDLVPWLSVGAKYGFRIGDVKYRPAENDHKFDKDWQRSSAHLGVIRADLHVVKKWDLLLEGRVMHMPEAKTTDFGALAAVYRHVGENFKVGAGYNFGRFSDDLRDLSLDDRGMFVNFIGKF
ncbi:TonB-dependent receptor [Pseudochrobactrum algeriensis]|uniref:TonB-dependent receptor n=1 Tax=Pseudochrobactrum algeriensis TaxID=2834768 RepID=UPI001BCB36BD|nr:TonB-dependent receptor [Pseudochrobactrum algeriensis]QVQ37309.1 TonB-dependent receptor [Pseudochrobactrum algeriensis]QVQ40528.1 TonB-dependent receptor [Pseudochrobactrum algeriensis]QVQ44451.1 TonB-dependent receptor [Pseudochrobactrum algeriensis]